MSPDDEKNLEQLIHRTLRELPARRAPGALEERVLAELARRAALPWWRRSFAEWPIAARAVFLLACGAIIAGFVGGSSLVHFELGFARVREVFAAQLAWLESVAAVGRALGETFEIIGRNIPPMWLYGALAFFGAMYAAFFGLSAAAYKTLHPRHA